MDFDLLGLQQQLENPQVPTEFTIKPTGEVSFKGQSNIDLIQQLMDNSDYKASSENRSKTALELEKTKFQHHIELEKQKANNLLNILTISFLGLSFVVAIVCTFITFNQGNHEYREPVRRGYCR